MGIHVNDGRGRYGRRQINGCTTQSQRVGIDLESICIPLIQPKVSNYILYNNLITTSLCQPRISMQKRMLYFVACLPPVLLTGAWHRPGVVWAVHYS
jgi:hypothetical protein